MAAAEGNVACREFRERLAEVGSSHLIRFANEATVATFDGSGLTLQDIVNEIGTALGSPPSRGATGARRANSFDRFSVEAVRVRSTSGLRLFAQSFAKRGFCFKYGASRNA